MKILKERFVTAVANEEGDFGVQQLVLIAVALAIGLVMFKFGGAIMGFINKKQADVGGMTVTDGSGTTVTM